MAQQMEYSPQNLEYAVSIFYNGEQTERAKAHAWLTTAQRVPEAWNFLWELLQPTKVTEVQFYAATTLHTKILRCWNEVPIESHEELKEKILQAVFLYSKGPKIVTNRLCISLAAFILQQGTVDLATILRPLSAEENRALLLEVLTVIPEEYNSMTMGSALRTKNRVALQQACPAVLEDMLRYLQSVYNNFSNQAPSEEHVLSWTTAANCAASWLTLSGEDEMEPSAGSLQDRLPLCQALQTVVQVVYTWNEAVSDSALDACEASLSAIRAAGTASNAAKYTVAANALIDELAALATPIFARDTVPDSINEELLSAIITCFVAIGECHAHTLVHSVENSSEGSRRFIEVLLAAQGAPKYYPLHETRSNLVFGFWYTLQDQLLNDATKAEDINPVWRDLFSQLLVTLINKSEAPPDPAFCKDELELLRCYRQDIADTVIYCYSILGDACWSTIESAFNGAGSESGREAALHIFLALADVGHGSDAPPSVVNMLQNAVQIANSNTTNKRILSTALDCLGGYAVWLNYLPAGAALACRCMAACVCALPRCAAPAALALRKLCAECRAPAQDLTRHILRAATSSPVADAWVRRQLAGAAGAALAAAPACTAEPLLRELAAHLLGELNQAAAAPPGADSGAAECTVALLAALSPRPELATALLKTVLPALPDYAQRADLVEPMFHILKQTVSTLVDDCTVMLPDIAQLTVSGFEVHPCPTGLDVVKLLVLVFSHTWAGTGAVLHSCVWRAASGAAAGAGADAAAGACAAPDLAEALFALLLTVTKKKPAALHYVEGLLPDLVQLACECVRLWEVPAARAACGWLATLAAVRPATVQPVGPLLAGATLRGIGGLTPRNQLEPLAELLLGLNKAAWEPPAGLRAWLRAALAPPDFPTPHASDSVKIKFIADVVKERTSKRRLLETVQEFSLVCRGLGGTEYARQTIAAKSLVT